MLLKPNRLAFALTLALATLPAGQVLAQDTADSPEADKSEAAQLGTITVTARKREETLQEVPIAVTAFSAQKLDDFNVEDLSDLDAQVPNLTVYAARGSSSTITAYIRGVGQADPLWGVDPGVGIYLDDVYIARPQGALLDIFDVERIEVLRGPQGSLYGKNTTGGAIKYVSRALDPDLGGIASLTLGTDNQQDLATSSQPCCQCYGATIWAGIDTLLIGARSEDVESLTGFDEGPLPADWVGELNRRGIAVQRDICREQARAALSRYRELQGQVY